MVASEELFVSCTPDTSTRVGFWNCLHASLLHPFFPLIKWAQPLCVHCRCGYRAVLDPSNSVHVCLSLHYIKEPSGAFLEHQYCPFPVKMK